MTEDTSGDTSFKVEPLQNPVELNLDRTSLMEAMLEILRSSGGKAFVDCSSLNQETIVQTLPNFQHATLEQLLNHQAGQPEEREAFVITGFSPEATRDKRVQTSVRSRFSDPNKRVIILSSGLPDVGAFDMTQPWGNGPIDKRNVYSITYGVAGRVTLTNPHLRLDQTTRQYQWVVK